MLDIDIPTIIMHAIVTHNIDYAITIESLYAMLKRTIINYNTLYENMSNIKWHTEVL